MAKKQDEQPQQTMEDYVLSQLKQTVILKSGDTLKDVHDGHELTAEVRAPFTQGGGLRRGCGRMEGHLGKMLQRKAVQIWPTTN